MEMYERLPEPVDEYDWLLLEDVQTVLKGFRAPQKFLEGDKCITASILPVCMECNAAQKTYVTLYLFFWKTSTKDMVIVFIYSYILCCLIVYYSNILIFLFSNFL